MFHSHVSLLQGKGNLQPESLEDFGENHGFLSIFLWTNPLRLRKGWDKAIFPSERFESPYPIRSKHISFVIRKQILNIYRYPLVI